MQTLAWLPANQADGSNLSVIYLHCSDRPFCRCVSQAARLFANVAASSAPVLHDSFHAADPCLGKVRVACWGRSVLAYTARSILSCSSDAVCSALEWTVARLYSRCHRCRSGLCRRQISHQWHKASASLSTCFFASRGCHIIL